MPLPGYKEKPVRFPTALTNQRLAWNAGLGRPRGVSPDLSREEASSSHDGPSEAMMVQKPACERGMKNDFCRDHFGKNRDLIIRSPKYSHGRIHSTLKQDDGTFLAKNVQPTAGPALKSFPQR